MLSGRVVESLLLHALQHFTITRFQEKVTFFQKWHNNTDTALGQEIDWIVSSGFIYVAQPLYFLYLQAISVLGACNSAVALIYTSWGIGTPSWLMFSFHQLLSSFLLEMAKLRVQQPLSVRGASQMFYYSTKILLQSPLYRWSKS